MEYIHPYRDSVTEVFVFRYSFGNDNKKMFTLGGFIVGKDFSFDNRYTEQDCFTN